jgi:major inositol transporter-like SP family MFS transporter
MSLGQAKPARGSQSGAPAGATEPKKNFLLKLTVISTFGGLLFGYDTGVISGALLYMREDLALSSLEEGVVVSSLLFGAAFGALLGGKVADSLGRKGALILCAALFFVGALGSATAPNVTFMVVSRIILGLAVGAASVTVPLFLAEMAPAHRRGRIVTINELMIVTGQFLAFVINTVIDRTLGGADVWRWMLGVAVIPAVLLFVGMLTLPDSPRWYAVKSRFEDTKRVLQLSRPPAEAAEEYNVIVEHAKRDVSEAKGAALRNLREFPWMRRILWIGIGLAAIQQATGVNTIVYFAPTILESTGLGASASIASSIALGVTAIIGCITGIYLLGKINRRPLLIFGFASVAASHVVLSLCFLLPQSNTVSYVILAAMVLFMFFVQTFAGPIVWLMLSEIFPMVIRGFAMGIAVFLLWTVNTIISFAFPILAGSVGPTVTFGLFVLINLGSTFFVYKCVPETRGRSLEELEDDFRNHDNAHLAHTAPVGISGS